MNEIMSYINTLGFPIVACFMLAIFLYKKDREDRDDRLQSRIENREERTEFLKTNQQLSENIKFFQVDVKKDISDLKHEQEKNSDKLDVTDKKIDRLIDKLEHMEGNEENAR